MPPPTTEMHLSHNPSPRSLASHKANSRTDMVTVMMTTAARTPSPLSTSTTAPSSSLPLHTTNATTSSTTSTSTSTSAHPPVPSYHAPSLHSPKPSLGYNRPSYPAYHPQAIDVAVIVSQAADSAATTSASGFRRAHSRPASVSMARSASLADAEKGASGTGPLSPRASHDIRRSHDFREFRDVRGSHDIRRSHDIGVTRRSLDFGATRPSHDFGAFPPSWSHSVHEEPPHRRVPVRDLVLRAARDRLSCGNRSGALGRGLIIGWVLTTLGFLAATAFWKGELFAGECGGGAELVGTA